jgi:ACR3 family arsenite efflux pump ArsB
VSPTTLSVIDVVHGSLAEKYGIKPYSLIGMLGIIFFSTLLKSEFIVSNISTVLLNFFLVFLFYLFSLTAGLVAKAFIKEEKMWKTFLYSIFLKNISISLALSVISFPESSIYLVVAFLVQLPLASLIMHKIE